MELDGLLADAADLHGRTDACSTLESNRARFVRRTAEDGPDEDVLRSGEVRQVDLDQDGPRGSVEGVDAGTGDSIAEQLCRKLAMRTQLRSTVDEDVIDTPGGARLSGWFAHVEEHPLGPEGVHPPQWWNCLGAVGGDSRGLSRAERRRPDQEDGVGRPDVMTGGKLLLEERDRVGAVVRAQDLASAGEASDSSGIRAARVDGAARVGARGDGDHGQILPAARVRCHMPCGICAMLATMGRSSQALRALDDELIALGTLANPRKRINAGRRFEGVEVVFDKPARRMVRQAAMREQRDQRARSRGPGLVRAKAAVPSAPSPRVSDDPADPIVAVGVDRVWSERAAPSLRREVREPRRVPRRNEVQATSFRKGVESTAIVLGVAIPSTLYALHLLAKKNRGL